MQRNISVIITAHNEGAEVHRTIESVIRGTEGLREIILVDDGSTDGSCDDLATNCVRLIRHEHRLGVAASRDEASQSARGDILCYLDAHQRVTKQCLDKCAELALREQSIVSPDLDGLRRTSKPLYGATFRMCPDHGFFSAAWQLEKPAEPVTTSSALRGPGYIIPRTLYDDVGWIQSLRGWGASEAVINIKAFFLGIKIRYLHGPKAYHLFRKKFLYETTWEGIWRNQALIARVCFAERTWYEYWLPNLFESHLSAETRLALESDTIQNQHLDFQTRKNRPDREFWTVLLGVAPPVQIK